MFICVPLRRTAFSRFIKGRPHRRHRAVAGLGGAVAGSEAIYAAAAVKRCGWSSSRRKVTMPPFEAPVTNTWRRPVWYLSRAQSGSRIRKSTSSAAACRSRWLRAGRSGSACRLSDRRSCRWWRSESGTGIFRDRRSRATGACRRHGRRRPCACSARPPCNSTTTLIDKAGILQEALYGVSAEGPAQDMLDQAAATAAATSSPTAVATTTLLVSRICGV
jgi:hypothetical protein